MLHEQDDVSVTNGGKAMRDDEACPTFHQLVHRFADLGLGAGVHAACRFIQDQYRRIGNGSSCDRKKLTLS
mgnify:CR=1 FL=1